MTQLPHSFYIHFPHLGTTADRVEVEHYDPYNDTWALSCPALKYVTNFTATACHGKLYVIGSCAVKYNALAMQCYNPVIGEDDRSTPFIGNVFTVFYVWSPVGGFICSSISNIVILSLGLCQFFFFFFSPSFLLSQDMCKFFIYNFLRYSFVTCYLKYFNQISIAALYNFFREITEIKHHTTSYFSICFNTVIF